ncbi:hypothetical protein [Cryptosporangium sp. NPDC048952]|uniref:hypothetical protein n=1 Tax=Cryptosporangium sp. NPDC048952 TaxID=3363961 RepID=UPI00371571F2
MDSAEEPDAPEISDASELWVYAVNCYLDDNADESGLTEEQRHQLLAHRTQQERIYTPFVLRHMGADPARLEAAIAACRIRAEPNGQGVAPDNGYPEAVRLGMVALDVLRASGAGRSRARDRLLHKLDAELTLIRPPSWSTRLATALDNTRWLRRPRRLTPGWHRRRRALTRNLRLDRSPPDRPAHLSTVTALTGTTAVGRIRYAVCPDCHRGLVYKVDAYPPHGGLGLGTMLVDAAVTDGPPADGYTWHTTTQFGGAVGFWRAMRRRHRTPFTAPTSAACPHMDVNRSRS